MCECVCVRERVYKYILQFFIHSLHFVYPMAIFNNIFRFLCYAFDIHYIFTLHYNPLVIFKIIKNDNFPLFGCVVMFLCFIFFLLKNCVVKIYFHLLIYFILWLKHLTTAAYTRVVVVVVVINLDLCIFLFPEEICTPIN
jgi:hypothetical protein